jgi:NADPH2:quinone reductase
MKAVALTRYLPIDDPQSLLDVELPEPQPGPRDLLVRVEAVSVNPVDTKVRAPKAQVEAAPKVLGYDAAGVVEAVGSDVTLFKPGDAVYYAGDITRRGSNAQRHLVDERIVAHKPKSLDFAHAAALPLTALTAWELLFDRFGYDADGGDQEHPLLVIAGAGGLGSITLQLARRAGLTVIATASRPETAAWCRRMGADHVIDHREPLRPQLEAAGFGHVDAIACLTSSEPYWQQIADLIAPQGRIGLVVGLKGPLDLESIKSKSASVHWEYMFTRAQYRTGDMIRQHEILARVADLVDQGELQSTLTQTLATIDAANLREAHRRLESGATIGKLVISGWT